MGAGGAWALGVSVRRDWGRGFGVGRGSGCALRGAFADTNLCRVLLDLHCTRLTCHSCHELDCTAHTSSRRHAYLSAPYRVCHTPSAPAAPDDPRCTVELARRLAACGVCALAVHGRTTQQRPREPACWERIKEVRRAWRQGLTSCRQPLELLCVATTPVRESRRFWVMVGGMCLGLWNAGVVVPYAEAAGGAGMLGAYEKVGQVGGACTVAVCHMGGLLGARCEPI